MIHNTIGPGAETTGNGILVVNAINGGTTAAGAFTLDNPELRAGAFDYRLFRGGLNGSDPNDWFLRSSFIVPPEPEPPEPIGPNPPPATLPPGVWPIIGPELATDGVVQPIARQMGLQTLGTLHQRIGDTLTLANTGGMAAAWPGPTGRASSAKASITITKPLPTRVPPAGWVPFRVASICCAAAFCPAIAMLPASTLRLQTATSM
jgi:hypothetical protein